MKRLLLLFVIVLTTISMMGQNEPVIVEAESGMLGLDYATLTAGDVTYIAPQTNYVGTTNPGTADKVASYTVNFADSGTYKLFLRVRVGNSGADDDSYFYANGFGSKDPLVDDDWIICNNVWSAGYTILTDVVEETGDAGTNLWKWVNFSDYTGYEDPRTFRVELGDLTQTFQIGARENGFEVDKIAFGREGIYYTVDNLNKGEAGNDYPPGEEPVGPPLADGLEKFLGCSFGPDSKIDFEGYWNQVTPGNGGKWGWVEGTRDVMSWTDLDEAYQVAMDNDFFYKHHVLVWGSQQPSWLAALDSAEQRAELEEWFSAVAERYPDLDMIEVVNEPLHAPPDANHEGGYIGALGGSGETGWDWIIEAFRMARSAFTDTTMLMINEYSIMNDVQNTEDYMEIIRLLMAEDTLIDAIGFQAHGFSHTASNATYLRNIDSLASTGLPIYVTELDIDGNTDLQQVHGYMNLFPLFWEHPAIKGITLWGFRPAMWRGDEGAYLIDEYGVERPAMLWLRAYLKDEVVPNEVITVSSSGDVTSIDEKGGVLQMFAEVFPDTSTIQTVYWQVSSSSIASINQEGVLTAVSDGTVTVYARSLELDSDVSGQMDITITGQVDAVESLSAGNAEILIYPNPSQDGNFRIENLENMKSVVVMTMEGRSLMNYDVQNETAFDINLNLPEGMYIIRISDGTAFYHSKLCVRD
ncbi:MAG: endo-1,4-beta-xylanase [Bacteroidales bacterium]|nr:endo-1,4-beta-xylanase [Bacteroidales bacterium]